jgi:hypothetical protein
LLQKFNKKTDFYHEPFTHIVIHNALPNKIYHKLLNSYPEPFHLDVNNFHNNKRYSYTSSLVETNENIHKCWKDFINYHTSKDFYDNVIKIFGREIIYHHGKFFSSIKKIIFIQCNKKDFKLLMFIKKPSIYLRYILSTILSTEFICFFSKIKFYYPPSISNILI